MKLLTIQIGSSPRLTKILKEEVNKGNTIVFPKDTPYTSYQLIPSASRILFLATGLYRNVISELYTVYFNMTEDTELTVYIANTSFCNGQVKTITNKAQLLQLIDDYQLSVFNESSATINSLYELYMNEECIKELFMQCGYDRLIIEDTIKEMLSRFSCYDIELQWFDIPILKRNVWKPDAHLENSVLPNLPKGATWTTHSERVKLKKELILLSYLQAYCTLHYYIENANCLSDLVQSYTAGQTSVIENKVICNNQLESHYDLKVVTPQSACDDYERTVQAMKYSDLCN